ncbi:MAG: transposase [Thaumarchaeota archaeon]|nr:transposase [Nitrososphaerota archaeon]
MAGKSNTATAKVLQKENGRLKTFLTESTLAVDALKNLGEEALRAVQHLLDHGMSLNGVLPICEVSRQRWYWKKKARESKADPSVLDMIRDIHKRRPFYGTRSVATELSRQLGRPVNRKAVRRLYRLAGWSKPAPPKADAKARWKRIKVV